MATTVAHKLLPRLGRLLLISVMCLLAIGSSGVGAAGGNDQQQYIVTFATVPSRAPLGARIDVLIGITLNTSEPYTVSALTANLKSDVTGTSKQYHNPLRGVRRLTPRRSDWAPERLGPERTLALSYDPRDLPAGEYSVSYTIHYADKFGKHLSTNLYEGTIVLEEPPAAEGADGAKTLPLEPSDFLIDSPPCEADGPVDLPDPLPAHNFHPFPVRPFLLVHTSVSPSSPHADELIYISISVTNVGFAPTRSVHLSDVISWESFTIMGVEAGEDGVVARAIRPSGDPQPTVPTDGPVGSPQYFSVEWNDHALEPSETLTAVIAIVSHYSGASPLQPARVTYLGEDGESLYSGDGASPVVVWVQPRTHEEL